MQLLEEEMASLKSKMDKLKFKSEPVEADDTLKGR